MDMVAIFSALDDHGFVDTSPARKLEVVQDSCDDICSREPWKFLEDTAAITLAVQTPPLPANFRAVTALYIPNVNGRPIVLIPERSDTLAKRFGVLTTTGTPSYYYFIGEQLRLFNVPDQSYAGQIDFIKNQATLTTTSAEADIIIPKRHHRAIVLGALSRLYAMEDDPELAGLFAGQYERRIETMALDTSIKQYDRTDRIIDLWDGDSDWSF